MAFPSPCFDVSVFAAWPLSARAEADPAAVPTEARERAGPRQLPAGVHRRAGAAHAGQPVSQSYLPDFIVLFEPSPSSNKFVESDTHSHRDIVVSGASSERSTRASSTASNTSTRYSCQPKTSCRKRSSRQEAQTLYIRIYFYCHFPAYHHHIDPYILHDWGRTR